MSFGKLFGRKSKHKVDVDSNPDHTTPRTVTSFEIAANDASKSITALLSENGIILDWAMRLKLDFSIDTHLFWTIIVSLRNKGVDNRQIFFLLDAIQHSCFARFVAYRHIEAMMENETRQHDSKILINDFNQITIRSFRALDAARMESSDLKASSEMQTFSFHNPIIRQFFTQTFTEDSDITTKLRNDTPAYWGLWIAIFELLFVAIPRVSNSIAEALVAKQA